MSQESFPWVLAEGENILWQGRPAPRCYTFRHWLQALIGTVLFLASSFWLLVGAQLVYYQDYSRWLVVAPFLLTVAAFFIGPGQLALARLRWEDIYYALTDQRLLVRNKLIITRSVTYKMADFRKYQQKKYGKNLLSLKLFFVDSPAVTLECLEHPELLIRHLPEVAGSPVGGKSV